MIILSKAALIAAYVLVALLLLSINLYSTWSWRIKALTVLVVSAFYVVTYFSYPPLLGWPTDQSLPKRFKLVAVYIEEPDKVTGDPGQIYLWATDMEQGPRRHPPRAYRVNFSPELHTKVVEAGVKMRKGLAQLGEIQDAHQGPHGVPTDVSQSGQKTTAIEFFDLPDPLFPEK